MTLLFRGITHHQNLGCKDTYGKLQTMVFGDNHPDVGSPRDSERLSGSIHLFGRPYVMQLVVKNM